MSAKYTRKPDVESTDTVNAIIVPDSSIGLALDFQDDQILSTEQVTAKITLGEYNRVDGWTYDRSKMGEWEVYIGKYDRRNIPEPFTETVELNSDGTAEIEMPMQMIGEESQVFVAVAKAKTPFNDYEHYIQSSRSYFIVFKGTKIEGTLREGLIQGRVPLRASASYSPDDRADSGSLGQVKWEVSDDGINWREDTEHKDILRWRKTYDTESMEYLRISVENKFTGEWNTSDALKIVSYTQPDLKLEQTNEVLSNEAATFALYDYETKVNDGDGVIEWSIDNRKTWFAGSAEMSFYKDELEARDVIARMKYNGISSDESLGESSFREARVRHSFLRSPKFYFELDIPELVELGTTHALKSNVFTRIDSLNERLSSEWVLPDGTVIEKPEIQLTFTEDMLEGRYFMIGHNAWVTGSKEETLKTTRERIESWSYTFPEIELDMPATVNYIPSKMKAYVNIERHFAPGVEYTFELENTHGVKVLEQNEGEFVIQFSEVGMHDIKFKVTNNRGQSKTVSQFVEVKPTTPLEIEIVKTFSNEFLRYPLDASLRTRVWMAHPEDRVSLYKWYLDGEFVLETRRYRESIADLDVGTHNIKVEVVTEFGQVGSKDFDVTVIPNTKPTGHINVKETDQYFELYLECEDSDGRIVASTWELNGELLTHSHNIIQFNKDKLNGTNSVIGRCYDDSYDVVEINQTLMP